MLRSVVPQSCTTKAIPVRPSAAPYCCGSTNGGDEVSAFELHRSFIAPKNRETLSSEVKNVLIVSAVIFTATAYGHEAWSE